MSKIITCLFTHTADGPDCLELSHTLLGSTQQQELLQEDPLSMAVKTTFNTIQELQELGAPEAMRVESFIPDKRVEGSITDISNAHVEINLPTVDADLPVQSAQVPLHPSVPNSPPIVVEEASSQLETQVQSQWNQKENHDDAQRAAFTQECSSQPLMSQDAYLITPQLYEGTLLFESMCPFLSIF